MVMEQVADRIQTIPQIRDFMQVAGFGMIAGQGSSYGMCIIKLKDWEERPDKADAVNAVIGQIYRRTPPGVTTAFSGTSGSKSLLPRTR